MIVALGIVIALVLVVRRARKRHASDRAEVLPPSLPGQDYLTPRRITPRGDDRW